MPSESEEAPSRQFVIHKAQSEGGEYKFSDNPIVAWFLRGNPLLKTGIVVLFLGLAFLLRYASERVHIPIGLRYLSVAGGGLAAVVAGWKLQSRKREYGLVLQGFGVAVMYLTSLAALKMHPLPPQCRLRPSALSRLSAVRTHLRLLLLSLITGSTLPQLRHTSRMMFPHQPGSMLICLRWWKSLRLVAIP